MEMGAGLEGLVLKYLIYMQVFQLALKLAVEPLADCMGTKDEARQPALYSLPCIKKWNDTRLQRIVRHFTSEVRPMTLSLLAVLVHKYKKKVEKDTHLTQIVHHCNSEVHSDTQFTCCTGTKVPVYLLYGTKVSNKWKDTHLKEIVHPFNSGVLIQRQFICFTGTEVQELTTFEGDRASRQFRGTASLLALQAQRTTADGCGAAAV